MSRNTSPTTLTLNAIGAFCSEWSESTLQEACQLVTDGTHDSPKEASEGFPLVTGKCIKGGRLSVDAAYLISEADHKKVISRSRAIKGDLLFANIGNSVGEVCLISEEVDISIKNLALFRPSEKLDGVFLLAYLSSRRVQDYIRNTILGSAQPFIGLGTLRGFPVPLPPITEQKAIAHILGTLDDKIELNRKTNETLEAMAKALFKSWFVDFDPVRAKAEGRPTGLPAKISDLFPDSFEESELGEIPSGWKVMALGMVSTFLNGYAFKSSDWQENGVPVVKIGSVKPGFVDVENVSFVSDEIAVSKDRYRLSPGDILIGMTGYVGEVGLVPISDSPPLLNQRVGRIAPMSDAIVSLDYP
jgi:type I restriction enzyme S subunit